MRKLALLAVLVLATPAQARVLNVEFQFSPFTGDAAKSDIVHSVEGKASVYLNNVLIAEQTVGKQEFPVLFEDREVAPAVWVTMESSGSVLRKGANRFRLEFEPDDTKKKYEARLSWATVNDETTTTGDAFQGTATNQSDKGTDSKKVSGKVVFERSFDAPFAKDQKWHHYPAVTEISEDDRKKLAELVAKRSKSFEPDFAAFYALLGGSSHIDLPAVKKGGCVEKAYAAGVRIDTLPPSELEFLTTGSAAVVVQGKKRNVFVPADPSKFEKIKGDEMQMCASIALFVAFPPRLTAVRSPTGSWELVP